RRRGARPTAAAFAPAARPAWPAAGAARGGAFARAAQASPQAEQEVEAPTGQAPARISKRLRDRLADGIAQSVDLAEKVPTEDQKVIKPKYVDLNGIDPWTAILGSAPVFGLSYGFWALTQASAEWFVTHPIEETAFYPIQRLGIAFQTAVVGLSSLAAGIFGFTALGLLLLGFRVLFGVATGELDPAKVADSPMRQSTAEKVRDIFTRDPVDVVMEERSRKAAERAG
ncbi:unnamed protein product, partial [Prorocentrum cordatum]